LLRTNQGIDRGFVRRSGGEKAEDGPGKKPGSREGKYDRVGKKLDVGVREQFSLRIWQQSDEELYARDRKAILPSYRLTGK
jgi:hypothetical protein